jgi:hypothetical protein
MLFLFLFCNNHIFLRSTWNVKTAGKFSRIYSKKTDIYPRPFFKVDIVLPTDVS